MACACGGKYMWDYDTKIKSDRDDRKFLVDVFKCVACSRVFFCDKDMKKRKKEKPPTYMPSIIENTPEEDRIYGKVWLESDGKYGVKPKDYVGSIIKVKVKRKKKC